MAPDPALGASPVVFGGENGIEAQYWVVAGEAGAMWAALGEFVGAPVPVDEGTRRLLEQNGLRMLAVPVERLAEVQGRMSVIGAVQRQWLGQAPAWVDIAAGPLRESGQMIGLHDGPLRLGPGRLRLLLRGWTIPAAPQGTGEQAGGALMHVEVVPQHQESRGRDGLGLALRTERVGPEDEGVVFTRMGAVMRLWGDVAVLIVPEGPGVEWKEPPAEVEEEAAQERPASGPPPIGAVSRVGPGERAAARREPPAVAAGPSRGEAGPPAGVLPSLGEAMLMSRPGAGEKRGRTLRAVVVLVPRVPERFELLPKQ